VSPLEGDEFLQRGGAHLRRLRCNIFRGGAVWSKNSARALIPMAVAFVARHSSALAER